jgi:phenylpropionate dioxygenase-like ring-hydroxylating dioxygenase large terminal subunit
VLAERDLRDRIGPVLSDGTTLRDLIDFDKREVSLRVLSDPELHRVELQKVFARNWIGLGHTSEIPNPGDFVLRDIGEDQVIITRTADGEISILLNVCAHRGMEVCWSDAGNQSQFKCPYHGWVFDGTGKLLGAPFEQEMYGDWDKSEYGLRRARVATRYGLIFGNFDASAPSFDDWLGGMGWYLDHMFRDVGELEVVIPPMPQFHKANWKVFSDQLAGDAYHGVSLHRSILDLMPMAAPSFEGGLDMVKVSFPELGHVSMTAHTVTGPDSFETPELAEEARYAIEGRVFAPLLFPTTSLAASYMPTLTGSTFTSFLLGPVFPRGVGGFESWRMWLVRADEPEEHKAILRKSYNMQLALGVDDYEAWPSVQRMSESELGREGTMKYNAVSTVGKPAGWPGPGTIYTGFSRDDTQWDFWAHWFDVMTMP